MKVAHIAIKVDDLAAAGEFYETVLGFTDVCQGRVRDHYSRHMTDGSIAEFAPSAHYEVG